MCGIAGFFGFADGIAGRIPATQGSMRRRGPDAQGASSHRSQSGREAILVQTRLKIIDLSDRADQPFRYKAKHLVFNGEIYNYLELRQQLEKRGHRFVTQSDTEVLIHHLDEFGAAGIADLEGMWAFALYDEADSSLTLCRDRFGEKPLYLLQDGAGIYFASEVKALMMLAGRKLAINYDQLSRFIVNGYKALNKQLHHQFFIGLEVLPPACVRRIDRDGLSHQWRYWNPCLQQEQGMDFGEAVAGTKARLIRSLEIRLRADVPLAFMLSGGVDSNSLIGIAKRLFGYDVHGFTVIADDERYGEADVVRQSVQALGIRHTEIPADRSDFIAKLRTLVNYHDAPVATTVDFAIWQLIEKVAAHGYRIVISGNGADELFSGYYDHHLLYLAAVHQDPNLYGHSLRQWNDKVRPHVRNPYLTEPERFVRTPAERRHIYLGSEEFGRLFHAPWAEPFWEAAYTPDLMRNRMANEIFHESVPVVLHEDDLNAMYHSVENRSPFLDRDLFEFANSVPTRHLVRDGAAKAVLREAVRGIAPDHIVDQVRKVGFNVPTEEYVDLSSPENVDFLTGDSPIFDYVDRERIRDLVASNTSTNSRSKALFNFISSKVFVEEFS